MFAVKAKSAPFTDRLLRLAAWVEKSTAAGSEAPARAKLVITRGAGVDRVGRVSVPLVATALVKNAPETANSIVRAVPRQAIVANPATVDGRRRGTLPSRIHGALSTTDTAVSFLTALQRPAATADNSATLRSPGADLDSSAGGLLSSAPPPRQVRVSPGGLAVVGSGNIIPAALMPQDTQAPNSAGGLQVASFARKWLVAAVDGPAAPEPSRANGTVPSGFEVSPQATRAVSTARGSLLVSQRPPPDSSTGCEILPTPRGSAGRG